MKDYLDFQLSGDFKEDIKRYFIKFDREETYYHTLDVIKELNNIKKYHGYIEKGSEIACYCHDLGRIVNGDDILEFCKLNDIRVREEEKLLPSILHPKISRCIANKVFNIIDEDILAGIEYHSTSRKNPSSLEMEVCLADKMSWKEEEYIEFVNEIKVAVKKSLEYGMMYYLEDLNKKKDKLRVYHSDAKEAFKYFKETYYYLI